MLPSFFTSITKFIQFNQMKSKERGVSLPPQTRMSPLTKALIEEIGELDRTSMHLIDSFRNKANSSAHSKRRKEYANSS